MPRGFWDWGVNPASIGVAPEISSSELAVRLGALSTYERLGEVVLQDGFSDGLALAAPLVDGASGTVNLYAGFAKTGGYSVRAITPAAVDGYSGVGYAITLFQLSNVGIETTFNAPLPYCWVSVEMITDDAVQQRFAAARYSPETGVVQIYNSAGAWVTVASGLSAASDLNLWSVLKLVIDLNAGYYKRVMFANRAIDLSAYPLYTYGTAGVVSIHPLVRVTATTLIAASAYLDNVIVTQNEP